MTIALSLFSGCGGMDRGFIQAGGTVVESHEIDTAACEKYPLVTGHGNIHQTDLQSVDYHALADTQGIFGGPPCQEFSLAGRHVGESGARNLWPETIKIVGAKRPTWFVFENVPALTRGKNLPYFTSILMDFTRLGYVVDWRILNAADYGVPQTRERVFVVGRLDRKAWRWPVPTHHKGGTFGIRRWVSWYEALTDWAKGDLKSSHLPAWILTKYPRDGFFDTLPENGLFPGENLRQGKNHIEAWLPAMTITNANHHSRRVMLDGTVYKLDESGAATLQTLPSNIGLSKSQIGNAVPPLLARALFEAAFAEEKSSE